MTHDTAVLTDSTFDLSETSSVIPLYTQTIIHASVIYLFIFLISSARASVVFDRIAVCPPSSRGGQCWYEPQ